MECGPQRPQNKEVPGEEESAQDRITYLTALSGQPLYPDKQSIPHFTDKTTFFLKNNSCLFWVLFVFKKGFFFFFFWVFGAIKKFTK